MNYAVRVYGMWPEVSKPATRVDALYRDGLTQAEIAELQSCSVSHVMMLLAEAGTVTRRTGPRIKHSAHLIALVKEMAANGDSWTTIHQATGLPMSTVRHHGKTHKQ